MSMHAAGFAIDVSPIRAGNPPACFGKMMEAAGWLWGPRPRQGGMLTFAGDWPHFQHVC